MGWRKKIHNSEQKYKERLDANIYTERSLYFRPEWYTRYMVVIRTHDGPKH